MSAFACEPGRGSEPGAGWTWAAAAAVHADVTLLTERAYQPAVSTALAGSGLSLRPVYVDLPATMARLSSGDRRIRLRHFAWQQAAGRTAVGLHEQEAFDVVHHLTWSADWQPVGLLALPDVPLVWGPVGGAGPFPRGGLRHLSRQAVLAEVARHAAGVVGRRVWGDRVAARAGLVICQNNDVARRFTRHSKRLVVEPNVALHDRPVQAPPAHDGPRRAVFAGRLVEWKGVLLAVRALASTPRGSWTLDVLGEGPARGPAETAVRQNGLGDLVRFHGHVTRPVLLDHLAAADALLYPSLHEACGWVVAEALSVGCPPVCLDTGGPPVLIARAGVGVCVPPSGAVPEALAAALLMLPRQRPAPSPAFAASRLPSLLSSWYSQVAAAPA